MEEALIVLIVFGCFVLVTKLALDYAKEKHRVKASSSGSSLTSSELKAIVQQAVEDVMEERFERIERRLDALSEPRLLSPHEQETDFDEIKPTFPPVQRERDALK